MSNKISSLVYDLDMRPHGKKFVLVAFADQANDDGIAWIAVESRKGKRDMLKKTSMSLRTLQGHIQDLEKDGHLERVEKPGLGCMWIIRPTPAGFAGVWGATPAEKDGTPADFAGIPYIPQKEEIGSRLGPPVDKCPVCGVILPPGLSIEQWEAFLDMRFALGKPVKMYAAGLLLGKLREMATQWVAGDIVDRSTVNAWPDLYPPQDGRVTGIRRVVSGIVAEPVGGLSEEDKAELARIAAIDDVGAKLEARKHFFDRADRRNTPTTIGKLVGELNLGPPAARPKKRR